MRISLASIPIADYDKALNFYTEILGFVKKHDIELGPDSRWITVVSPEEPNGTELLLEPNAEYPAMKALKESLVQDGIPYTAFLVDDVQAEYNRLRELGVEFAIEPTRTDTVSLAIFDDTCGNLIQIYQVHEP